MRPGIIDCRGRFPCLARPPIEHLGLDLFLERNFAVFQNFVNVRAQLARLRIDDGEFFLDAEGENMIFGGSFWELT